MNSKQLRARALAAALQAGTITGTANRLYLAMGLSYSMAMSLAAWAMAQVSK